MRHMIARRAVLGAGLTAALGGASIRAVAQSRIASAGLGCYVGNPNGNDSKEMSTFEQSFDRFAAALGAAPAFMNAFTDFSGSWDKWVANAGWLAWSWSQSSRSRHLTPVIGLPMATNADWATQPAVGTFRDITAGRHDAVWSGIVAAWRDNGYRTMYLRPGYEMNGSFMPWFMGRDASSIAAWSAAFARISSVVRTVPNASVRIVWNPVCINDSGADVASGYPGDAAVDVIGIDLYNNFWPRSLYSFSTGTTEPSLASWRRDPANRTHFWDYPGATRGAPTGQTGVGWGMVRALAFALEHDKPVAVCETGVGVNPQHPEHGLADDGEFPNYLQSRLFAAGAPRVEFINIWDVNVGDGNWRFSDGSKPSTLAGWRNALSRAGLRPT
jgi:hypothetical protein